MLQHSIDSASIMQSYIDEVTLTLIIVSVYKKEWKTKSFLYHNAVWKNHITADFYPIFNFKFQVSLKKLLRYILYLEYFSFGRQFFTKKNNNNTLGIGLPDVKKLKFVETSVSWIEDRDVMDSCLTLNFGYEAPLP